jgi:hypothetical protein
MSKNPLNQISGPQGQNIFTFSIHTDEYRSQPIPGVKDAKIGHCFVSVADLPNWLEEFMEVNPRVPNRTQKGILSGPVIKGITSTLLENPEDMALKNQGIFLLVDHAEFSKATGGEGRLTVSLSDKSRHGIVNGGHTFAAIRDTLENASELELDAVTKAYVRLHLLQGIDESKVPEIAEGLNRSKQVDDPSLDNLRGYFNRIKDVMKDRPGSENIAYYQGDEGEIYISEVLAYASLFNCSRYDENNHPYRLYKQLSLGLKSFEMEKKKSEKDGGRSPFELLIPKTPEILILGDKIKLRTKDVAKSDCGFEFGRMKVGKERAAAKKHRNIHLPFIGQSVNFRVPNGWLFPMLAAFRANVRWDLSGGVFEWKVPVEELFEGVFGDLVRVCVSEHRESGMSPEWVGKRESAYRQCYDKVRLYLALKGKL